MHKCIDTIKKLGFFSQSAQIHSVNVALEFKFTARLAHPHISKELSQKTKLDQYTKRVDTIFLQSKAMKTDNII